MNYGRYSDEIVNEAVRLMRADTATRDVLDILREKFQCEKLHRRTLERWYEKYPMGKPSTSLEKRPTTPIQREAWELCRRGDHGWMVPHTKFDGVAFEAGAWVEGNTVYEARRCYFCGETVSSQDFGGAPFYSGMLGEKPDWADGTSGNR